MAEPQGSCDEGDHLFASEARDMPNVSLRFGVWGLGFVVQGLGGSPICERGPRHAWRELGEDVECIYEPRSRRIKKRSRTEEAGTQTPNPNP